MERHIFRIWIQTQITLATDLNVKYPGYVQKNLCQIQDKQVEDNVSYNYFFED